MIALVATLVACSPSRLLEAVRVLEDIEAAGGASSLKDTTGSPERQSISVSVNDHVHRFDIYQPAEEVRASMVLVPGASPGGLADPRLIAFANTFARAHFLVVVPDIPGFRSLRVSASDAEIIADAVRYVHDLAPGRPLGVTAISFAVGPAVLALLDLEQKNAADFIVTVGGYYDLKAVLTFFTTGYYREVGDTEWQYRTPNAYGKWVFVLSNVPRLDEERDQHLLRQMALRKMKNPEAKTDDLADQLSAEGRSIINLLNNRDPEAVPALIDSLPKGIRAEVEALDLSPRTLSDIPSHFVIVHGAGDPIIPERESAAFAQAVESDRSHLFIADGIGHVDADMPDLLGAMKLTQAIYLVLSFRDEGTFP